MHSEENTNHEVAAASENPCVGRPNGSGRLLLAVLHTVCPGMYFDLLLKLKVGRFIVKH